MLEKYCKSKQPLSNNNKMFTSPLIVLFFYAVNAVLPRRRAAWVPRRKSQIFISGVKGGTSNSSLDKYVENIACSHLNSLHSQLQLIQKEVTVFLYSYEGQEPDSFENNYVCTAIAENGVFVL